MNWNFMGEWLLRPLWRIGTYEVTIASLVQFFLTVVFVSLVAKFVRRFLREGVLKRTRLDEALRYTISRIAGYVVWVLGLMLGLSALGIDLTSLTVVAGALGVGIGFGLQNIVNNLVSGLILLGERSIALGDRIDVGGAIGRVIRIGARSTSILTNDNIIIIVPNSEFIQNRVINWSYAGDMRVRIRLKFGVSFATDPRLIERIVLDAAVEEPGTLQQPEPTVVFGGFGENTLDFELRAWTSELIHRPGVFKSNLYHRIWKKFQEHHIEVPVAQREINLKGPLQVEMKPTRAPDPSKTDPPDLPM